MVQELSVIGKGLPLKDGREKVTGTLKYSRDIMLPRMLHAKILRSPYPHARIVKIDTTKAESLRGVKAIITHKDVPLEEWEAHPNYNFRKRVLDERLRFVGDKVAAVAAESSEIAEEALSLIEVEYKELPHVFDLEEALKPGAPQVRAGTKGNTNNPAIVEWGDLEKGFREADSIFEHTTRLGSQQHATLGLNAWIANWEQDRLTIWTSTQTPFELRDMAAKVLKIPQNKVRVIGLPTGGSFGLWWTNEEAFIAAILAKKARRPVKIELTRDEVFSTIKVRESSLFLGRLGVKKDGSFTAIDVKFYIDNGAYGNKNDSYQAVSDLWGPTPNGRFEQVGVATNKVTNGCMRGVGDLELNFGMEQLIDKAAEELGMDPIEIRLKNHIRAGHTQRNRMCTYQGFGVPFPNITLSSCGLSEAIKKAAVMIGWKERWKGWRKPIEVDGPKRRGLGMSIAAHQCTMNFAGPGSAIVHVYSDGSVQLLTGVGRSGQGIETTQAQIVAEELGVPFENVTGTHGDTETCPWCPPIVGSVGAHQVGRATRAAAADAKRQICEYASKVLEVKPEELDMKDGMIFRKLQPERRIPITDVTARVFPEFLSSPKIIGRASLNVPETPLALMFMIHFVEVEVDIETGKVKVLRFVAVHESGKIINREVCENQVSSGVYMGAGFGLSEEIIFDKETGAVLNPNFVDYKMLKVMDLPDIEIDFVEPIDPNGPFGAKGIGEGATGPAPTAIAQAIYNATGVRINCLPITPERLLKAIKATQSGKY